MAKKESVQKIGDAIEQKEIPFEVGEMGDFPDTTENLLPKLKDRNFDDADMDNFDIDPLRKLLDAHTKLSDLRNNLAGNDKLEDILNDVLKSTERLQRLSEEATRKKN